MIWNKVKNHIEFEAVTAGIMKNVMFRDVMLCIPKRRYRTARYRILGDSTFQNFQLSGTACYLYLLSVNMKATGSSETSVTFA
jgi:hypothetical protein